MGLDRAYFPVSPTPLRMLPRLQPFGRDCGNPAQDRLFFQLDEEFEAYRHAKISATRPGGRAPRERLRVQSPGERERGAHRAILAWIDRTLASEYPSRFPPARDRPTEIRKCWDAVALDVQEDLVAVQRTPAGTDAVIAVHVCFPSGWRPETTAGWDFRRIHKPVPQFADHPDTARSLADAMIERGPYVRFVWTVCADDFLDHHPEEGKRLPWEAARRRGWLRVERQVTVPFPEHEAALFLIRTYLTPFEALGPEQQTTLATAIDCMPKNVLRYKNLDRTAVRSVLDRSDSESAHT